MTYVSFFWKEFAARKRKVLAGDLLEWEGLLWSLRGPLRNKYPECREIIDRLLAALKAYNDRRSARLHPSAEWSLHA